MNVAEMKSFVKERRAGGLGDADIRALVANAGRTKPATIAEVVKEADVAVTAAGAKAFLALTGTPLEAAPVDVDSVRAARRAPRLSRTAHEVSPRSVESVLATAKTENDSIELRMESGRRLDVELSERLPEYIKKGYFKLYRDEKDRQDDNGDGRMVWFGATFLVPTPKLAMLEEQIEKHARRADAITKKVGAALEKMRTTMHASRVNGFAPFDLKKLKPEVSEQLQNGKHAVIAYERAAADWASDTQRLDYPDGEVMLMDLLLRGLRAAGPKLDTISFRDLAVTKDLIRAAELLLPRPEVEAVDPGDGVRINYNTDTIVKNGGSVTAWKQEVQAALDDALITSTVDFSQNNNADGMLKLAQRRLGEAIGKSNVSAAWQIGDKDFGRVRGTEVTLYVKPAQVAAARSHAETLLALFGQYGYDMKAFSLKIEAEQR